MQGIIQIYIEGEYAPLQMCYVDFSYRVWLIWNMSSLHCKTSTDAAQGMYLHRLSAQIVCKSYFVLNIKWWV